MASSACRDISATSAGVRGVSGCDAAARTRCRFKTAAAWNAACGHWSNPEVDKLLEEARQTASAEQRKKLYGRLAELINEDGTVMIPWVLNHIVAYRERVQGFQAWPDLRIWLKETWVTS